jgi:rubrerythrin
VKTLFSELRDEEVLHQRLVQEQLDKLPPDPSLRTEDFEDEPAPQ